jgi:hypothetical protein
MIRRTEISIETDKLVIVGRHQKSLHWCGNCRKSVEMITSDQAAIVARVNSRTIFQWADTGRLHSTETPEGLLLICPHSL